MSLELDDPGLKVDEWEQRRLSALKSHVAEIRKREFGPPVQCVETGQVFETEADAARAMDTDRHRLRVAIHSGRVLCGRHWVRPGNKLKKFVHSRCKAVRCIDTGTVYVSTKEAADAMGVVPSAIQRAIYDGGRCCNKRWQYVRAEPHLNPDAYGKPIELLVVVGGAPDAIDVANLLGCHHNRVYEAIKSGKPYRGYVMRYVPGAQ